MKSGGLNLLEPSGPHGACYGTALPLPLSDYLLLLLTFRIGLTVYLQFHTKSQGDLKAKV